MVDLRINEEKTSPVLAVNEAARDNGRRAMPAFSHTLPLELCPSNPLAVHPPTYTPVTNRDPPQALPHKCLAEQHIWTQHSCLSVLGL